MKRTVQHILGVAVALAMTASGAFAVSPIQITTLPYNCNIKNQSYQFMPGAVLTGTLTITADGVQVDMQGATINNGGADGTGIYINVSDPVVNGVQTNSGIVIKNGRIKCLGNSGIMTSGWFNGAPASVGAMGTVNGVTLLNLTVLVYGGSVNCITDFGNGTVIKNCYLGNGANTQYYPPFQDSNGQWQYVVMQWTLPGYGVACYGNNEDVKNCNFSLVAIGNALKYFRNSVAGDTFENNNLGTAIPGVSGSGYDFANWIVPIPFGS